MLERKDNLLKRFAKGTVSQVTLALDTVDRVFTHGPITATIALVAQEINEGAYLLTGDPGYTHIDEVINRYSR